MSRFFSLLCSSLGANPTTYRLRSPNRLGKAYHLYADAPEDQMPSRTDRKTLNKYELPAKQTSKDSFTHSTSTLASIVVVQGRRIGCTTGAAFAQRPAHRLSCLQRPLWQRSLRNRGSMLPSRQNRHRLPGVLIEARTCSQRRDCLPAPPLRSR